MSIRSKKYMNKLLSNKFNKLGYSNSKVYKSYQKQELMRRFTVKIKVLIILTLQIRAQNRNTKRGITLKI